ncbi:MAG: glycosyltransferase family 2 protein [Thermoanaerobaculia bacterium]
MSAPLSVLMVVKNEQDRLPDALASVSWADEIVVADTGSTDQTRERALAAGARVVEIPWDGFVAARNRALEFVRYDWVLLLDADERVTPELRDAIRKALAKDGEKFDGYRMPRLSHLFGRPVRHGTWYPDLQLRLGRKSRGLHAVGGRVHESLVVLGAIGRLKRHLIHHPYRNVSDALRKAASYAQLGADDRFDRGARGSAAGLLLRPLFEFFRCYVLKAGLLDGVVGFRIAILHASSYFLRAAFLLERERKRPSPAIETSLTRTTTDKEMAS